MGKRFIYGSILMLILNIFIRFFSLSYDVTLSRILGAEAIGLFEISLSVLMLFSIFVSSGISTSITKLVAENHSKTNHNIDQIFKDALFMNLVTSILLGIFTIFFSKHIALTILKNESMLFGVYLLVPAIIITSISSVYKSYFYGLRNIVVPTIGEIIESLVGLRPFFPWLHWLNPTKRYLLFLYHNIISYFS